MRARYNEVRKQLIDEYYAGSEEGERRTPPSYAAIDDRARDIVHAELLAMIRAMQTIDDVKKAMLFILEEPVL